MGKITIINKNIEINKNHIDNYQLESEVGTKRMKENFHKNAVTQRNIYVSSQQEKFEEYKKQVYKEMKCRFNKYNPINKDKIYKEEKENLDKFKEIIIFNNKLVNSFNKLGLLAIISDIKEDKDISLDDINKSIKEFINSLKIIGISLTKDDFNYSMFTYNYMVEFFKDNNSNLKEIFESIYWECPDFLKHLKLNLWFILDKYKKEIDNYTEKYRIELLKNNNISFDRMIPEYYDRLLKLDVSIRRDEYSNLQLFLNKKRNISDYLDDSNVRKNNFNSLLLNEEFDKLSEANKNKFYFEILDLSKTLSMLKLYYRYEFIIKDIQEKFSKRVENKNVYENKLKEIKKEESKRKKIFSNYLKGNGIGFLAKKDDKKISSSKLEMNEQITKLYNLYAELHDLEIVYNINKNLSDVSSLYDLFMLAYSSYFYLEKIFIDKFSEDDNFIFSDELNKYFEFIYNPDNEFLTKINGFVAYDIADIISDKYKLFEINVDKDSIMKDSIDSTIDTVNFIKLIKDISDSNLSLYEINFIVKYKEFDEIDVDLVETVELLNE